MTFSKKEDMHIKYRWRTVLLILAATVFISTACTTPDNPHVQESAAVHSSRPTEAATAAAKTPAAADPTPSAEPTKPVITPDPLGSAAQALLDNMSLEEKIYQLFIVAPEQLSGSGDALIQVGGVIFFAENIQNPEQVTRMIADMQAASRLSLFIAVDEEGGAVARLGRNPAMGTTAFPPMGDIGASGDTENARNVGRTIGNDIKSFGFNLNFAPVADVNSNPNNPVIANRAFSSDPNITADMVAACVGGFKESGVLCTLKHFPGHGDTSEDSHYGAASSYKTLKDLQACELLPFQAGIAAGADMVMTGHISLPNVTGNDTPASLSYEITTELLRGQLGFDGLIVTDSMTMEAITDHFTSDDAAVQALQAGADIILMPADLHSAASGILHAVNNGKITEKRLDESVYRILYAKLEHGIIG